MYSDTKEEQITRLHIDTVIEEARNFSCCPHCGNPLAKNRYCTVCEREYEQPGRALFFADYLKQKYK